MTDHQRADSIYMEQSGVTVTPNLNMLADESCRFTRAYNTCPLCIPARAALSTGIYPTANGAVFNDCKGQTARRHKTIHQYFAESGYAVGHVGINHIKVKPELKSRNFFNKWVDDEDYLSYCKKNNVELSPDKKFRKQVTENRKGVRESGFYSSTETGIYPFATDNFRDIYFCRESVDFICRAASPFALFINLWAPHPPLILPRESAEKFDPDKIVLPENVGKSGVKVPPGRQSGVPAQLGAKLSLEEWRKVWAAHLGLVNLADFCIGTILDTLKSSGHYDNTIIVFTSDHGDHLGQHGMYQKMEMYEPAINVPLIIRHPEGKAGQADSVVSHLDIVPTLLDFTNIHPENNFSGDSLADTVINGSPANEKTVFCQYSGNPCIGDIRRAAISQKYKYVYTSNDLPELYDLYNDPLEMNNLAGMERFRKIETDMLKGTAKWHKQHGDFINFTKDIKNV